MTRCSSLQLPLVAPVVSSRAVDENSIVQDSLLVFGAPPCCREGSIWWPGGIGRDDKPAIDHSCRSAALHSKEENVYFTMNSDMDGDAENQVEMEEKTRLINQVLELQHTLEDLSARVDAVKEENLKLKSENQVLGQYIENLMSASSVFQTTDTKSKRK
ncbi:SCOC protein, partial [Polypterus senegalus]